ncbi:MAG: hypothetical protein PHU85_18650, partial [Phycisphaerae bacterium]|nr:hypothetical protein [Phycisphaerae bacterium]
PPPARVGEHPPLPVLTGAEKAYLIKLARAALEHSAQTNGKVYEAKDVPESLRKKDYVAYVTARLAGHLVESAVGDGGTLAQNIAQAAAAMWNMKEYGPDRISGIKDAVLELNVLGPGQQLPYKTLDRVAASIIPGVHGLAARVNKKTITFKESVAPTYNYSSELILAKLLEKAGWTAEQVTAHKDKVVFFRFRGIHLLEQRGGAEGYVDLFRCAQLIGVEQVTAARVNELIDLIGPYMLYRQLGTGLFSYAYSPADAAYVKDDNGVRQAGAAWVMARLAQATGKADYELAAVKAVGAAKLRYLDPKKEKACATYAFEPDRDTLGATALLVCALTDVPNNQPLTAIRDKLAAGVLAQQRPDGSFKVYFGDREDDNNVHYYPGEALLALMKVHKQTGDRKYLDAVERAYECYSTLFDREPNASFVAWQAQAWALAFDATGKKEYRDFVLRMADYLLGFQPDDTTAGLPEDMAGAFVGEGAAGGIGSAAFLEGVVAAHRVAVKAGDAKRADKYARSLRLGARFIDQLTFKKLDAYYSISPKDVIGGLKMSPADHTIRIDNCQHGVCVLLGVREELFPKGK